MSGTIPANRKPGPRLAKVNPTSMFSCPHEHASVSLAAKCIYVQTDSAVLVSIWKGRAHILENIDGKWLCQCPFRSTGCAEVEEC